MRDYRVEVLGAGTWTEVAHVSRNRRRRRVHAIDGGAITAIRITVLATNGASRARLVAMRAYEDVAPRPERSP